MPGVAMKPGGRLGPYEIVSALGAGGMGEVYRARDPRLEREVAIKVLPPAFSTDTDRLMRFEQEARAAGALSHPNVLVVYDVGVQDGAPYVVSELLEGETLSERIRRGPVPPAQALTVAADIAHGLAAAHERGIVHRDLKPDNVFLTRDGRVKILDFGLAKLEDPGPPDQQRTGPVGLSPGRPVTTSTTLLGTAGYVSPEQVRGDPADGRSDLFALGVILFEMLSGVSPFKRETTVDTLHAILREEPPWLAEHGRPVPAALERVVLRCLEKQPDRRFQSARDLGFHLEAIAAGASGDTTAIMPQRRARTSLRLPWWMVAAGILAAGLLAFFMGRAAAERPLPTFQQVTFRRGTVHNARFAPGGETFVYSAGWEGGPVAMYTSRLDSPESRPLEPLRSNVMAVSSRGELALLRLEGRTFARGTLARSPLGGGAPRELVEDAEWADWSPDGSELAVVRSTTQGKQLEFPAGTTLYETAGWISHPRVSPDGDVVAFIDHEVPGDNRGTVTLVDRRGTVRALAGPWKSAWGLAWHPRTREVWFAASEKESARALHAVDRRGRRRTVASVPLRLTLHDISSDGRRVLLSNDGLRRVTIGSAPGEARERDLSWLDYSNAKDLSPDGRTLLFSEDGEAGGAGYSVYLRRLDGSAAVRLGQGRAFSLSADGRWALTARVGETQTLALLPTGPGQTRLLPAGPLDRYDWAAFVPDGSRVVIVAAEPGRRPRLYVQDVAGGPPRSLSEEGVSASFGGLAVTPDGTAAAVLGPDRRIRLYRLDGSGSDVMPGAALDEVPIQWSPDGRALFVFEVGALPARVIRVERATGARTTWRELEPADPSGVLGIARVRLAAAAPAYVYTFSRILSDVYVGEGLE